MSLAAVLRTPVRRAVFSAPVRRAELRPTTFRKFTTNAPPPAPKSNTALYASIAAFTAAAAGYYFYTSSSDTAREAATAAKSTAQAGKAAVKFTPTKADYQKNTGTGGSNFATMRFEPESLHGANAGLHVARELMEKVKQEFPWISYGDLWTLAGVAAIQEMGGPKIPWRPGRIDGFATNATPDGRLPDASQGSQHVRDIFYRMGFDDQEIVALIGAHALGRCHPDRSGYEGPWTFSPTTFTNDFFKLLYDEKWVWKKWNGPKQLQDKKTGSLMMLPTDYVLVQDKSFKKYAKAYADDQDLFFKDFSAAFAKLLELGVPSQQFVTSEPWTLKTVEEQKA
ncbi:hypothetical protein ID866_1398 [Astraeus odoratus]|nr:hypothetical protein ID866_1398 [Astraeus odoratus]